MVFDVTPYRTHASPRLCPSVLSRRARPGHSPKRLQTEHIAVFSTFSPSPSPIGLPSDFTSRPPLRNEVSPMIECPDLPVPPHERGIVVCCICGRVRSGLEMQVCTGKYDREAKSSSVESVCVLSGLAQRGAGQKKAFGRTSPRLRPATSRGRPSTNALARLSDWSCTLLMLCVSRACSAEGWNRCARTKRSRSVISAQNVNSVKVYEGLPVAVFVACLLTQGHSPCTPLAVPHPQPPIRLGGLAHE